MSKSPIEWTEHTWNPIVGCSIVSPGCTNCYAMKMASRIEAMGNQPRYAGTTRKVNGNAIWTGKLACAPDDAFLAPLRRKKPTIYFVNSMGDLFHEDAPDEWIDRVFAVMALCPQHTFQILTKRAERMRQWSQLNSTGGHIFHVADNIKRGFHPQSGRWPLPNVWLGVSTERQQEADERIPLLLQTPAAVRFISAEPLLGPIDLGHWISAWGGRGGLLEYLDWIIVGGESGSGSRPMHPDWARSLRDQCAAADVPFFFKQWGAWFPIVDRDRDDPDWRSDYTRSSRLPHKFRTVNLAGGFGFHGERVHLMQRYSKKSAGRLLDGKEHNGFPAIAEAAGQRSPVMTPPSNAEAIVP